MPECRTRLAPSPTGALHLGNARTFLINWALARRQGWRILLRIEDLDGPRIKAGADAQAIATMRWMGLDWDEGPIYQLHDLKPYHAALTRLGEMGLIYPCRCTRSMIVSAQSAPHGDEHDLRYPGTCRPAGDPSDSPWRFDPTMEDVSWRVRAPDGPISFADGFMGNQTLDVDATVGDFVVSSKAGLPAYQLAVVVDDARQGVTHVVRGDDLISSTPRQIHLARLLRLPPIHQYTHLPLVLGPDGRRLAKRHGDTRLVRYMEAGVRAERLIGLLASWSGLGERREMTAAQFAEKFRLEHLPHVPAVFTEADEAWLGG